MIFLVQFVSFSQRITNVTERLSFTLYNSNPSSMVKKPRGVHVSLIYLEFARFFFVLYKRLDSVIHDLRTFSQMIVKIDLLFLDLESRLTSFIFEMKTRTSDFQAIKIDMYICSTQ